MKPYTEEQLKNKQEHELHRILIRNTPDLNDNLKLLRSELYELIEAINDYLYRPIISITDGIDEELLKMYTELQDVENFTERVKMIMHDSINPLPHDIKKKKMIRAIMRSQRGE